MKFAAAVLLGAAATASAAVLPRQDSCEWQITDMSFSGERFSIYVFDRLTVSNGIENVTCSTSTSYGGNEVGPFPWTPCSDPDWSFGFFTTDVSPASSGYSLQITHLVNPGNGAAAYNETGCQYYPASDIKTYEDPDPNADYQYLDTPSSFNLSYQDTECVYA